MKSVIMNLIPVEKFEVMFYDFYKKAVVQAREMNKGTPQQDVWDVEKFTQKDSELYQWTKKEFFESSRLYFENINALSKENVENFVRTYIRRLTQFLFLALDIKINPGLAEVKVEKPVFVLGFPRSGTTFFHRVLSADPRNTYLNFQECIYPNTGSSFNLKARRAVLDYFCTDFINQGENILALHFVHPEEPDECNWTFEGLGIDTIYPFACERMEAFRQYRLNVDMSEKYKLHKYALQAALFHKGNKRLFLKSPTTHAIYLKYLFETYPDATVIYLHRDPVSFMPSNCKLFYGFMDFNHKGDIGHGDKPAFGKFFLKWMKQYCDKAMENLDYIEKERPDLKERIIHVPFGEASFKTLDTAIDVYKKMGIEVDDELINNFKRVIDDNPIHKRGKVSFSLEEFGLTKEMVEETFSDYIKRYGCYHTKSKT